MIRPTFFGIEIGKTGLTMSQLGLDVTGHNIANVETKGYTRQRLITTAYDPNTNIGRVLPVDQAHVGGGAKVKILDQIRDAYLDRRYRTENTINAYWQRRTQGLSYVESYFDNIKEETSISYSVASLFEAMKVLAEDTVEGAPRTLLREAGKDLSDHLNAVYGSLVDLQSSLNLAVTTTVGEINRIAKEIVELNKSIYGYEITGHLANDLRDKRNLLVDELSTFVDVKYREEPDGTGFTTFSLWIGCEQMPGGIRLVNHDKSRELGVRAVNNTIEGEDPVWEAYWVNSPNTGPWGVYFETANGKKVALDFINSGIDLNDSDALRKTQRSSLVVQLVEIITNKLKNPALPTDEVEKAKTDLSNMLRDVTFVDDNVYIGGALFMTIGSNDDPVVKIDNNIPTTFRADSGELQALMEMRDSADVNLQGIPYYINMLNNLARALVQEVNAQHRAGYNDPTSGVSTSGLNFFDDGGWWTDDTGTGLKLKYIDGRWYSVDDVNDPIIYPLPANQSLFDDDETYFCDPGDIWADASGEWYKFKKIDDKWYDVTDPLDPKLFEKRDSVTGNIVPITDPADINASNGYNYYKVFSYVNDDTTVPPSYNISKITAKDIKLSAEVLASEFNIACADVQILKHGEGYELQRGNNKNMNELYRLFNKKDISLKNVTINGKTLSVDIGSFDGYVTKLRFDVASTLNFAKKNADNSTVLTVSVENQRTSISGVSLDEEMTNIVKYQHAYSGASRVITAMDEALERLINATGRVGL